MEVIGETYLKKT